MGVTFNQIGLFPLSLTGVTIRASGGKHKPVNLEADLRLPILRKAAGTKQVGLTGTV